MLSIGFVRKKWNKKSKRTVKAATINGFLNDLSNMLLYNYLSFHKGMNAAIIFISSRLVKLKLEFIALA